MAVQLPASTDPRRGWAEIVFGHKPTADPRLSDQYSLGSTALAHGLAVNEITKNDVAADLYSGWAAFFLQGSGKNTFLSSLSSSTSSTTGRVIEYKSGTWDSVGLEDDTYASRVLAATTELKITSTGLPHTLSVFELPCQPGNYPYPWSWVIGPARGYESPDEFPTNVDQLYDTDMARAGATLTQVTTGSATLRKASPLLTFCTLPQDSRFTGFAYLPSSVEGTVLQKKKRLPVLEPN